METRILLTLVREVSTIADLYLVSEQLRCRVCMILKTRKGFPKSILIADLNPCAYRTFNINGGAVTSKLSRPTRFDSLLYNICSCLGHPFSRPKKTAMSSMSAHCFLGVELRLSLLRKQGLPKRTVSFGFRRSENSEDGNQQDCLSVCGHLPMEHTKSKEGGKGMSLANLNQEVLNEMLLPLLKSKQKDSKKSVQKLLMLIRLVSKPFKVFGDTYCCILFPESFMHLILAKHNPTSLELFLKENALARNAFKEATDFNSEARGHIRQTLVPDVVSDKRAIRIGQDYYDLLDPHEEFEMDPASSAQYWTRDDAINELRQSVEEIQRPFRQYFVNAGVVTAEDIDFHVFAVNTSSCDCSCGGLEDTSRFFLALKSRTLESSYEDYGIIKSSMARSGRDMHLQPLDVSPISPHALWMCLRILSTLASVGGSKDARCALEPGSVAAIAELAGDKRLSWKFLSRASFSYI